MKKRKYSKPNGRIKRTFVRRNCRLPLYQVIIAFGLDPELSQEISYRRSATSVFGVFVISTVSGFTALTIFRWMLWWNLIEKNTGW